MTLIDAQIRDQAMAELALTTVGRINSKWKTPPAGTHWANAEALLAQIGAGPPVPPPPPAGWSIAPPVNPTVVMNAHGWVVNDTTPGAHIHDYVIHGTGDSAIICEPGKSDGALVERIQAYDVAKLNTVTFGKHLLYADGRNITAQDITGTGSAYSASGMSMRYPGFLGQRLQLDGFELFAELFQEVDEAGTFTLAHGAGATYNADCGIFLSVNRAKAMTLAGTITDIHLTGVPSARWFLRADSSYAAPSMRIAGCSWNGKPITPALVSGVPSGLTILP